MHWSERLSRQVARVRGLVRGRRIVRGMDEEFRFHLEMEARDRMMRGESPAEARRQAHVRFGGEDRYREESREAVGIRWLDDTGRDVRVALRSMRRGPGFAAMVVVILALGIGANTAVFGILDRLLIRPLPYPDDQALVMLWQSARSGRAWVSAPDYRDWRSEARSFDALAALSPESFNVAGASGAETASGAAVSASFFGVLGVMPAVGRTFIGADDIPGAPEVVVLSDALWRRRFDADAGIVGRVVDVDGTGVTVVGVMPLGFAFPAGAELWRPLRFTQDWHERRGIDWLQVVGRMSQGMSRERVEADLDRVAAQLAAAYPETNSEDRIAMVPLREQLFGSLRAPAAVLMGAVAFVLLMVCASVASLLIARATTRGAETAVRRALGSGRGRLFRSLLAESLVLALIGGMVGIVVARVGGEVLLAVAPLTSGIQLSAGIDARVLTFALGLTIATGLLFGLAPAIIGSRSPLERALRAGAAGSGDGRGSHMLRRVLVAGQLAVAIVLVSSGVLLAKSLDRLLAEDIGFEPDALMTARISLTDAYYPEDADRSAFYDRLLARLAASPGIRSVAMTSNLPFAGSGITFSFEVEGAPPVGSGDEPLAGFRVIGPRYFESMGIPLRSGREFDERDRSGAAYVAAIDETLARQHFAGRDPIGARVRVAREWREVIAVVGAIRHTTLDVAPVPAIYVPFAQRTAGTMFVVVRGERRIPDAALVGDAVRAVDRSQPVRAVQPMNDYIAAVAGQPRFLAFIVGAFGSAALLIAALGVYGIVAFTVSRRANEYAIRIALGARPASIVRNALRDGLLLLGVGLPIGVVAALSLSGVLEGLLHQVRATDAGTLAFVTALFTVVTLGASWLPARRAAGVEPMRVLRAD